MATSSAEPHLAAIPESRPISDLPGSALGSPRSTSDSPGRGSAPISPTSRLLRPTLSWQAKAGWIPEAPAASGTTPTSIHSNVDVSSRQMQEPTVALRAPDQAATAGRLSPSVSARWQSTQNTLQPSQGATGNAMNTMMSKGQAQQSSHSLAAQQKLDQLTSLLQGELAKHGQFCVTPWQQQRQQLRSVGTPPGSPVARSGSPGHFRYADASVDTLQQQRAKLKPVQTSKHAPLPVPVPVQQGFDAAPTLAPLGAAHLRGVHPGTAPRPPAGTGTASAVRVQAAAPAGQNTAARASQDTAARAQLGQPQQAASPASQLRTKYSQLTNLLQSTALQRGISLSQVPIPATHNKPGSAQQKRVSLEEVRTSFRSFTTASSAASSSKPAPLRRVSTGAITPAFLKKKDKQDQELLEALSQADAAADTTAPTWAPNPSSRPDLVEETPAVCTRGKEHPGRPTGNSFDIKLLVMQDEVHSSAEADMTDPNIGGAQALAQVPDSRAGQTVGGHAARDSAVHGLSQLHEGGEQTAGTYIAASTNSQVQPSKATQLQTHGERTGDSQVAGMVVKDNVPLPAQVQQVATLDDIKMPQMTDTNNDNGINSSSVTVDIMLAQHTKDMTKDAQKTGQKSNGAPKTETGRKSNRGFGQRMCCFCCSTKE